MIISLGKEVSNLSKSLNEKAGVLVFFASYPLLKQTYDLWMNSEIDFDGRPLRCESKNNDELDKILKAHNKGCSSL
jgi:Rad3-related DNA helicase